MQTLSCEMPSWMNHKLESRMLGEIATTSDIQFTSCICGRYKGVELPGPQSTKGQAGWEGQARRKQKT